MSTSESSAVSGQRAAKPAAGTDIIALGVAATVIMWGIGYVGHLPLIRIPSQVSFVLMLHVVIFAGVATGRLTGRGLKGGLLVGFVIALLNLLILGSVLQTDSGEVLPRAAVWLPGWFALAMFSAGTGAWLGARKYDPKREAPEWTRLLARAVAGATLLLLIAGGLVTSAEAGLAVVDWPNSFGSNMFLYPLSRMTGGIYYEHAHRLFGSLVGLTTIILAVQLQRTETRAWVKRLAWVIVGAVVIQGILGGLRVTGYFTLSTSPDDVAPSIILAVVHGVFGQAVFGAIVGISVIVDRRWNDAEAPEDKRASTERFVGMLAVAMLLIQLLLGALVRHVDKALLLHISWAIFVVLAVVAAGIRGWGLHADKPPLFRVSKAMLYVVTVQVLLGFSALAAIGIKAEGEAPAPVDLLLATAHQATGALLLACAVMFLAWTWGLMRPPPETV